MLVLLALSILALVAVAAPAVDAAAERAKTTPSAEKFWRMVRNEGTGGEAASGEVFIYGYIGGDSWDAWLPDDTYPKQFAEDLQSLGDVGTIHLRINSLGGNVWGAQAIHSLLRDHPAQVVSHIDGIAASAASVIAVAGDQVIMPANGMMMIHNPSLISMGDARQLRADADFLDKVREGIVGAYQHKTGMERSAIINLMNSETWMTAQEAVNYGFADAIEAPIAVAAAAKVGCYVVNGLEMNFRGQREWPEAMLPAMTATEPAATEEPTTEEPAPATEEQPAAEAEPEATTEEEPTPEAAAEEPTEAPDQPAEEPEPTPASEDPVAAERARVQAILDLATPGAEQIIKTAIDSGAAPGDVAQEIVKSPAVRNAATLAARRADAPAAVAGGDVPEPTAKEQRVNLLVNAYKRLMGLS